jgi:hypothetical protein
MMESEIYNLKFTNSKNSNFIPTYLKLFIILFFILISFKLLYLFNLKNGINQIESQN